MNDDESDKLINLTFAWLELREHLTATTSRVNANVARSAVDLEIRLMELIDSGERTAQGRTAAALKSLRQLKPVG